MVGHGPEGGARGDLFWTNTTTFQCLFCIVVYVCRRARSNGWARLFWADVRRARYEASKRRSAGSRHMVVAGYFVARDRQMEMAKSKGGLVMGAMMQMQRLEAEGANRFGTCLP